LTTLTGPSTGYPGQVLTLASMTAATGTALNIFGTVSFYDNGVLLGSPSITDGNGDSAWSYSTTVQGIHNITAVYQGNTQFAPSTSNVLTIMIAQLATQTTLTGPSTAYPGQVLSLASMTAATHTVLNIFGPVTFYDNGVSLGSKSITDGNGDSGWSYSTTVQGVHNLTAIFQGSTQFAPSTSNTLVVTVTPLSQTITFSRIPNVPLAIHALTMTAHSTSALHVTYSVTGPATLSGSTITLTGTGLVTVTASQSGNTEFAPATSVVRSFTVTP
jgi:Bacterial Ig-like domain (group 3)